MFFAFVQRIQWVGLLAVFTWMPVLMSVTAVRLERIDQLGGPGSLGPFAAVMLIGPPLLIFAIIGLLAHDVARRAGLTEWTWREALTDASFLVVGGIASVSLLFAAVGAWMAGSIRLGLLEALGAILIAGVVGGMRRRGAGLTPHAVTHGELRDRVFALAARAGVKLKQLYVVPFRRFRLANAFAVQGNVVMLTDVLLEHLDRDEVDAVLAHEMAHLARKDPAKLARGILAVAIVTAVGSSASGWLGAGVTLPLAMLGYLAYRRRIEHATDRGAITLGAKPEALITGLGRLSRLAQVPVCWGVMREWLMTHPSLERRARRVAATVGAEPAYYVTLAVEPPPAGPRWGIPESAATPRAFSSEFKRRVIARLSWSQLLASVLVPASIVAAAGLLEASEALVVPRLAILAAAVLGGFLAWQVTWALMAHRPLAGLKRILEPGLLGVADPEGRTAARFFVGLAPGAAPRLYEGFVQWDVGSLTVSPERCVYAGEQLRFSITPGQVVRVWLDTRLPGWIRVPVVRVQWERHDGSAGTFGLVAIGGSNVLAARAEARRLLAMLEAWRKAVPATPITALQSRVLPEPPSTTEITSASPRSLLQPQAIVLTWIVQVAFSWGASLAFGLSAWPTQAGALDVALAAVFTQILAMLPYLAWREPAGEEPATQERLAA